MTDHVPGPRTPVRIGNASGFYGDRFAAMREMLEGGELDVLTGDYLAELTMLILGRDRLRDPGLGYARTFLRQLEDCLGLALHRGVAIVTNAGGLNPAGPGRGGRASSPARLGLDPKIGYVDGRRPAAARRRTRPGCTAASRSRRTPTSAAGGSPSACGPGRTW